MDRAPRGGPDRRERAAARLNHLPRGRPGTSPTNEEGGVIVERLEAFDDKERSYTYSIVRAPFPVTDYRSTLTVREAPGGHGARVERSGRRPSTSSTASTPTDWPASAGPSPADRAGAARRARRPVSRPPGTP
ncbi:SRPBCC family protein [Streptomyces olivaceoviridis]|uniref:SRPBCC family protein n=1 Tax=Streptomyces olivaceoviridis TaxID=1921 RepID=UPI0036AE930D